MTASDDARRRADELIAALSPQEQQAMVEALRAGSARDWLDELLRTPEPVVGQVPDRVRGVRVRVDLLGAKPPVWRRLELPGDLTLDRLHTVLQAAMGWLDCHLHRFRTGNDSRAPYFVTAFDVEDGEDGILEDTVRLDQLLTESGDRLWYDYDFGDGWAHVVQVEAVLDEPPTTVRCTTGRNACPPEDCGGIWGYADLAAWVRGGCDPVAVPAPFDTADDARDWLPLDWHPDRFDPAEATAAIAAAITPPVAVPAELAALRTRLELHGDPALTLLLEHATTGAVIEVGEAEAAQLLEPYLLLLEAIGDGVQLTAAGYLPPALVGHLADRTGVTGWWIGAANREDLTVPVARLRASARTLGLISVRKGRLAPTAVARRYRHRPLALWQHLISRLPVGRTDFDRQAGWTTAAVIAGGAPAEHWHTEIAALLQALGWRSQGRSSLTPAAVVNPTLEVFDILAGTTRGGRPTGRHPAVAAAARAVITP
ncbi:plasmid pRiA4b ORF-3 family protein (plasmid) [Rhodococcus ruber]|uniref:plasmid pRiA4b ORF-3 family protein n=1 Tax=Rhodococcus ruber TaxID=1830 RepID=UPI002659F069|nr:plasmid pRiA4b ORF-3 family protein [Rhodococcus ruber]WKK14756.1 plasmid pRiA4b ORF-3 family protein [Rhodococcus ruber]